jgi:hypothetical protein
MRGIGSQGLLVGGVVRQAAVGRAWRGAGWGSCTRGWGIIAVHLQRRVPTITITATTAAAVHVAVVGSGVKITINDIIGPGVPSAVDPRVAGAVIVVVTIIITIHLVAVNPAIILVIQIAAAAAAVAAVAVVLSDVIVIAVHYKGTVFSLVILTTAVTTATATTATRAPITTSPPIACTPPAASPSPSVTTTPSTTHSL